MGAVWGHEDQIPDSQAKCSDAGLRVEFFLWEKVTSSKLMVSEEVSYLRPSSGRLQSGTEA